jgi:hypothetical protein
LGDRQLKWVTGLKAQQKGQFLNISERSVAF